jgi:hypothetical protein
VRKFARKSEHVLQYNLYLVHAAYFIWRHLARQTDPLLAIPTYTSLKISIYTPNALRFKLLDHRLDRLSLKFSTKLCCPSSRIYGFFGLMPFLAETNLLCISLIAKIALPHKNIIYRTISKHPNKFVPKTHSTLRTLDTI